MTTIEQKLMEDLATAERELTDAESLCHRIRWQVQYIRSLLNITAGTNGTPATESRSSVRPTMALDLDPKVAPPFARLSASEVIEVVLRQSGRPMRVGELADIAIVNGYGGPNAERRRVFQNFTSLLAKQDKKANPMFVRVGRGTFDLAERVPRSAPHDND